MEEISAYANLTPDPTSSIRIYWIDERAEADGSALSFAYGVDPADPTVTETVDNAQLVPEKSGIYLYAVEPEDLNPDTTYHGEIIDDEDVLATLEWHTLPASLPDDGLRIVVYSDIHIDTSWAMGDPEDMAPVSGQHADLALFVGDYITWGDDTTDDRDSEDVVDWWLDLFREWYGTLNEDRLHPVFPVPGNHEVGNHSWDGTGSVNPAEGHFQFFHKYPAYLDPVGKNYGAITIGDYLQVLGLDTHSADPTEVTGWLKNTIKGQDEVRCTIPIHHSPTMSVGNRQDADDDLQALLRDEWSRILWDHKSVVCNFSGHIHLREYTVSWEIVEEEPDGDEYFVLDSGNDGYLQAVDGPDDDRIVEFVGGYHSQRSWEDDWYSAYQAQENQFYSLTLTDTTLEVIQLDESGTEYESHSFALSDPSEVTEPPVKKRLFKDGTWVPPVG